MYKAILVAKYIVNYSNSVGNPISNLKLQKLLYYTQAAFLVEKNEKCFDDKIVAWAFGPVVPEVYQVYRVYGREDIPNQKDEKEVFLDFRKMEIAYKNAQGIKEPDRLIVNKVINAYKHVTNPYDLVKKTHEELPWMDTEINKEIDCNKIKKFYIENPQKIYTC